MAKKNYDVAVRKIGKAIVRAGGFRHKAVLSKTGVCTVAAESSEEAMALVNTLPAPELDCVIIWNSNGPALIDAWCLDESFAPVYSMKELQGFDLSSIEIDWGDGITATDAEIKLDT